MTLYSHSRLSCFEQCRLRFKFQYIDKIKTDIEQTIEAFLGSMVHEALEKLYKDLKFEKIISEEELIFFYYSIWEDNYNDGIVIVREEYSHKNYKDMGERFLREYYKRYFPFDDSKSLGLETEKTVDIGNGHSFHIRIDRLALKNDGTYEIHDYKTSNLLPAQEYLDSDRQLALYAYGVKKMYPDAKNIKLIWHFLAFDKEMCSSRTDEELENLRKNTLKLISEIEECTSFPAKESALCSWCNFKSLCPNFKHLYELKSKNREEYFKDSGLGLVDSYYSVSEEIKKKEKELEKIKEALIEFSRFENCDSIYGSEFVASVRRYPRLSFPKKGNGLREEFFDVVKKLGLWNKLSCVDVYSLTKMINNGELPEEFVKILESFIERGENTRIYIRKRK